MGLSFWRQERDVEELRGELLVVWLVAGGLVAVCLITVLMWLVGCWYCCCGVVEGPTGDMVALWLRRRWRRREKRLKRLRRERGRVLNGISS